MMQKAPSIIEPPPATAVQACEIPDALSIGDSAQVLASKTLLWIKSYGCAETKRKILLEAWPK